MSRESSRILFWAAAGAMTDDSVTVFFGTLGIGEGAGQDLGKIRLDPTFTPIDGGGGGGVPEPSPLALFGIGIVPALRRRRGALP